MTDYLFKDVKLHEVAACLEEGAVVYKNAAGYPLDVTALGNRVDTEGLFAATAVDLTLQDLLDNGKVVVFAEPQVKEAKKKTSKKSVDEAMVDEPVEEPQAPLKKFPPR